MPKNLEIIRTAILVPGIEHPAWGFRPLQKAFHEKEVNVYTHIPEGKIYTQREDGLRKSITAARTLGTGRGKKPEITLVTTGNVFDLASIVAEQVLVEHIVAVTPPELIRYVDKGYTDTTVLLLEAKGRERGEGIIPNTHVIPIPGIKSKGSTSQDIREILASPQGIRAALDPERTKEKRIQSLKSKE